MHELQDLDFRGITFGAEHELADIRRNYPLPEGFGWDERDVTIVNSNGVANDPKGKLYGCGGEVNTPPTGSISSQVDQLTFLKERFPESRCNYRSNLHTHIRVPGLSENLPALKRLARYNHYWLPRVLPIIEPIPTPKPEDYPRNGDYRGAMRRWRRRKRSHQTLLPWNRVQLQLAAETVEEFLEAEVPRSSNGQVLWHAQARAAVNLRQLRETGTLELRHFPGTLSEPELECCLLWTQHYTLCALSLWAEPEDVDPLATFTTPHRFPTFEPYNHGLEIRYRMTCHDGTNSRDAIARTIAEIEDGSFDWEAAEQLLKW